MNLAGYRGVRAHAPKHCGVPHAAPRSTYRTMARPQDEPPAREVLREWARAAGYLNRAAEFLEHARCAPLPAVRRRYIAIAQHYRKLAEAEKRAQIKIEPNAGWGLNCARRRHASCAEPRGGMETNMDRRTVMVGFAIAGSGVLTATAAQLGAESPLIAAFAKTLSAHDIDGFAALFAEDYVNHQMSAAAPKPAPGASAKRATVSFFGARVERDARPFSRIRGLSRQWRHGGCELRLHRDPWR